MPHADHNATCPFCGREDSLRAHVTAHFVKVYLMPDGYILSDAQMTEDEVTEIECIECSREVPIEHYWHSPEECDCAEKAGICPKCGESFFTHNDDGSCVED